MLSCHAHLGNTGFSPDQYMHLSPFMTCFLFNTVFVNNTEKSGNANKQADN